MGIFRDLVSNVANARMMEEQNKLAYNVGLGNSLITLARNPTADPGVRAQAAAYFTDLMGKHGGKQGKALQTSIQSLLTGYITSTSQQAQMGGQAGGQPPAGASPAALTGQQPFPGIASGIQGMPESERQRIPPPLATPATLAPGAAASGGGLSRAAQGQEQVRRERGGFRGVLGHLAGGLGTVGKELLGVPPGQPETPYDPQAFGMTPEQKRKYDYEQNLEFGRSAGLRGDALTEYALTGKPPSDFGKTTGPTDEEIRQAGDQFDRLIAPQMDAAGVDPTRKAAARVQYVSGMKMGAPPPEQLYSYTDPATGESRTVSRSGGVWRDANTGAAVELPANAQPFRVGQQRAPSATLRAQDTAFEAYANEVLKTPGTPLTALQRLDALTWAKRRADTDPEWAAKFIPVAKTVANPQGDPYIDMMAQEFITNEKVPPGGMSGKGFARQEQIVRRADEMLQTAGYTRGDLPVIREGLKANNKAFDRVVQQGSQLAVFDGTIQSNLANLRVLNEKYERTDYPFANRVWDAWRTGTGNDDARNFAAQLHILAIEWAKAMSGLMSNANVPVTSAADAENIMSRFLSNHQITELFNQVIVPDLNNRVNAQNGEKQELQNAIRNFTTLTPQTPTGGAATLPAPPAQTPPAATTTPAPTPPPAAAAPPPPERPIIGPQTPSTGDRAVDYLKRHPPPR